MGRVYVKRLGFLCCLIAAAYFAVRNFNLHESFFHTKWFFEYRQSSSWRPSLGSGLKMSSANDAKKLSSVIRNVPLLKDGVRPNEQRLQRAKCPACFGTDICEHINSGALDVESSRMMLTPEKPRKIAFAGALHTSNAVVAKTLVPSEFNLLDQHICLKAKEQPNCDVSMAALKMLNELNNLLSIEGVQHLHKSMKKTRSDIPLVNNPFVC